MQTPVSIMIVDDQPRNHETARLIFNNSREHIICAHAFNGYEMLQLLQTLQPDIILMDINMPGMDGIEATQKVSALYPGIKVLGFSSHNDPDLVADLIMAGAKGYIQKAGRSETKQAITAVMGGKYYISPGLLCGWPVLQQLIKDKS